MGDRPLAFIDVDGVLNVCNFGKPIKRGMTQHLMTVSNGRTYPIRLKREIHRELLRELEEAGFELVWGSTWEDDANLHIAPVLGLPQWPVAYVSKTYREGPYSEFTPWLRFGEIPRWNWKAPGILAHAEDRPFIWIDDDVSPADHGWARRRSATIPTKLIKTIATEGLMPHHVRKAKTWLIDNGL